MKLTSFYYGILNILCLKIMYFGTLSDIAQKVGPVPLFLCIYIFMHKP